MRFDTHSDPGTPGGPYADDLVSLGFVHHMTFGALLKNTLCIAPVNVDDYDAGWVADGGGPLRTFRDAGSGSRICRPIKTLLVALW